MRVSPRHPPGPRLRPCLALRSTPSPASQTSGASPARSAGALKGTRSSLKSLPMGTMPEDVADRTVVQADLGEQTGAALELGAVGFVVGKKHLPVSLPVAGPGIRPGRPSPPALPGACPARAALLLEGRRRQGAGARRSSRVAHGRHGPESRGRRCGKGPASSLPGLLRLPPQQRPTGPPGRLSLSSRGLSPDNPGWHAGRIPIREAAWKVGE